MSISTWLDDILFCLFSPFSDTFIDKITLPCILGIKGWQSVEYAEEHPEHSDGAGLGGLEVLIKFAQANDRENVIDAARAVGWSPLNRDLEENSLWEVDVNESISDWELALNVDKLVLPMELLYDYFPKGHGMKFSSWSVYARYKFYDKGK